MECIPKFFNETKTPLQYKIRRDKKPDRPGKSNSLHLSDETVGMLFCHKKTYGIVKPQIPFPNSFLHNERKKNSAAAKSRKANRTLTGNRFMKFLITSVINMLIETAKKPIRLAVQPNTGSLPSPACNPQAAVRSKPTCFQPHSGSQGPFSGRDHSGKLFISRAA